MGVTSKSVVAIMVGFGSLQANLAEAGTLEDPTEQSDCVVLNFFGPFVSEAQCDCRYKLYKKTCLDGSDLTAQSANADLHTIPASQVWSSIKGSAGSCSVAAHECSTLANEVWMYCTASETTDAIRLGYIATAQEDLKCMKSWESSYTSTIPWDAGVALNGTYGKDCGKAFTDYSTECGPDTNNAKYWQTECDASFFAMDSCASKARDLYITCALYCYYGPDFYFGAISPDKYPEVPDLKSGDFTNFGCRMMDMKAFWGRCEYLPEGVTMNSAGTTGEMSEADKKAAAVAAAIQNHCKPHFSTVGAFKVSQACADSCAIFYTEHTSADGAILCGDDTNKDRDHFYDLCINENLSLDAKAHLESLKNNGDFCEALEDIFATCAMVIYVVVALCGLCICGCITLIIVNLTRKSHDDLHAKHDDLHAKHENLHAKIGGGDRV